MSCAAPAGGAALDSAEVGSQAVIQGVVTGNSGPVGGAYVRLLDRTGEFTAEVPTGDGGEFRFFAAPGEWTLRTLAPGSDTVDCPVEAALGAVAEVEITV